MTSIEATELERKAEVQHSTLLSSLNEQWFKLPIEAVRDVGPASQTLAGLLKITKKETFSKVRDIAQRSRVPVKTCRKHLDLLCSRGWIANDGRQRTKAGRPRRTCTLR